LRLKEGLLTEARSAPKKAGAVSGGFFRVQGLEALQAEPARGNERACERVF